MIRVLQLIQKHISFFTHFLFFQPLTRCWKIQMKSHTKIPEHLLMRAAKWPCNDPSYIFLHRKIPIHTLISRKQGHPMGFLKNFVRILLFQTTVFQKFLNVRSFPPKLPNSLYISYGIFSLLAFLQKNGMIIDIALYWASCGILRNSCTKKRLATGRWSRQDLTDPQKTPQASHPAKNQPERQVQRVSGHSILKRGNKKCSAIPQQSLKI